MDYHRSHPVLEFLQILDVDNHPLLLPLSARRRERPAFRSCGGQHCDLILSERRIIIRELQPYGEFVIVSAKGESPLQQTVPAGAGSPGELRFVRSFNPLHILPARAKLLRYIPGAETEC